MLNQSHKWKPPAAGTYSINVDAAIRSGDNYFSIGMVFRNYEGLFIRGKTMKKAGRVSVFEAEAMGVLEALSWIDEISIQNAIIQSDSLLTVAAIKKKTPNLLEVGNIIICRRTKLEEKECIEIVHVRKQTNRVAHLLARHPCSIGCSIEFISPPDYLLETLVSDIDS